MSLFRHNSATTQALSNLCLHRSSFKIWGNPSSLHSLGIQAAVSSTSLEQMADLLRQSLRRRFLRPEKMEGEQLGAKGCFFERFPFGKHIIVSNIEHPAVKRIQPSGFCRTKGFEMNFAPVDKAGFVCMNRVSRVDSTRHYSGAHHGSSIMKSAIFSPFRRYRTASRQADISLIGRCAGCYEDSDCCLSD